MTNQVTKPGPLAPLMQLRLKDLSTSVIESWAAKEGQTRPASARLAWRLLSVFLNWCAEKPEYENILPSRNPAKTKKVRESLGKPGVKNDVLTREQLTEWFAAIRSLSNPMMSAYFQVLLLTGARPSEVLNLRWDDVDTKWKSMTIGDKVEGVRDIPLTPYIQSLINSLPRHNAWIFASTRSLAMDEHNIKRRTSKALKRGTTSQSNGVLETSSTGRISKPNTQHTLACQGVGINNLTLNGLRRSFSSLTEWMEIPTGVVAQIQGHKPSATAEKHYKRRPLDLLRLHHERIEAWMLEQAGIKFIPQDAPLKLRAVALNQ